MAPAQFSKPRSASKSRGDMLRMSRSLEAASRRISTALRCRLAAQVLAAHRSVSTPPTISNPALLNPRDSPPQPLKRSRSRRDWPDAILMQARETGFQPGIEVAGKSSSWGRAMGDATVKFYSIPQLPAASRVKLVGDNGAGRSKLNERGTAAGTATRGGGPGGWHRGRRRGGGPRCRCTRRCRLAPRGSWP
jgi:hypothetical protein